ncbi:MAG: HD domain-containing protein, partial [Burkholderiales bacterium]
MPAIDSIFELMREKGSRLYGEEAVTQFDHALQCATLAEASGASDELVTAALLHDLGHLVPKAASSNMDDRHQYLALPLLRRHFAKGVLEPIRLHVDAKRYLCATQPDYMDQLSPASKRSLALQGGPFTAREARRFESEPFSRDAVRL